MPNAVTGGNELVNFCALGADIGRRSENFAFEQKEHCVANDLQAHLRYCFDCLGQLSRRVSIMKYDPSEVAVKT